MEQETARLSQYLQAWLQTQGVPDGADSVRVVFDGTNAHIVAMAGAQRVKRSVPFPLHIPKVPVMHVSPPAVAKKKASTRRTAP